MYVYMQKKIPVAVTLLKKIQANIYYLHFKIIS